jgi:hypothetical protein
MIASSGFKAVRSVSNYIKDIRRCGRKKPFLAKEQTQPKTDQENGQTFTPAVSNGGIWTDEQI